MKAHRHESLSFRAAVFGRRFLLEENGGEHKYRNQRNLTRGDAAAVQLEFSDWRVLDVVKRKKGNNNPEKPATMTVDEPPSVFTGFGLPIDFEDVLMVAIANSVVGPKRKMPARHNAPRRER